MVCLNFAPSGYFSDTHLKHTSKEYPSRDYLSATTAQGVVELMVTLVLSKGDRQSLAKIEQEDMGPQSADLVLTKYSDAGVAATE